MGVGKITVGTVNWYSVPYIVDLFQSLKDTVVDSELEFIVCDNTNGQDANLKEALGSFCEIIPHKPVLPDKLQPKRARGSYMHASGLDLLLSKVTTEFCLFVDPDCLVIARGWDTACKSAIAESCVAIGAPYHSRKISKYHDFPSPIFVFFKTEVFRAIKADWTPYMLPLTVQIRDKLLRAMAIVASYLGEGIAGQSFYVSRIAKQLRRLLGNSSKDTGWRIPDQIKEYGYSAELFVPAVISQQLDPRCATEPAVLDLMNEFEMYLWQGIPLITHYYGNKHRSVENLVETNQRWRTLAMSVIRSCSQTHL